MGDPNGSIAVEQPVTPAPSPSMRFVSVDARANASDFGSGLGEGLQQLSRGLDSASDTMLEVSNKRDALFAQNVEAKAEADWKQKMFQAKEQFTLDPSQGMNYGDSFKSQFNDYQNTIMQQNPNLSDNAKNEVMTRLNRMGASLYGDALDLQGKASTDWSVQTYQDTTDQIKQNANGQDAKVTLDPNTGEVTSSFDGYRQQLVDAARTAKGIVPTQLQKSKLLQDNIELDKAEIDTSTQQLGAGTTAKLIADGKFGTALTIPQRTSEVLELNRLQTENTSEAIRQYHQASASYQLQVQETGRRDPVMEDNLRKMGNSAYGSFGPAYAAQANRQILTAGDNHAAQATLDQIAQKQQAALDSKYPTEQSKKQFLDMTSDPNHEMTPEEQQDAFLLTYLPYMRSDGKDPQEALSKVIDINQKFRDNVQVATQVSQARAQLPTMNIGGLQNKLDSLDPDNPIDKNLKPFIQDRIRQINQDPYSVAVGDDKTTQSMLSQAYDLEQNKAGAGITLQKGTTDDRANSLYQSAIGRAISTQQTINPDVPARVMSSDEADGYIGQIKGIKSSEDASQILGGMQKRFGPYFNDAINQMVNNPKNPLPPGMAMASSILNEPYLKDYINAISVGQGKDKNGKDNPDYKQLFKEVDQADTEKEIDSQTIQNDSLNSFASVNATISNSPETMKMVSDVRQSVSSYAKYLYLNPPPGGSYSAKDAVDVATKNLIEDHAAFAKENQVPYMISREGKNGQYSDTDVSSVQTQLHQELQDIAAKYPSDFEPADKNTSLGDLNTPGQIATQQYDIQDNGYWINTPDNKGVMLYVKANGATSREGIPIPNSYRAFDDMLNKSQQNEKAKKNITATSLLQSQAIDPAAGVP